MASASVSNGKDVGEKELDGTVDPAVASDSVHEKIEELDRISSSPDEVVAQIVSRLPLKDAIRTSVLSTRWRGLWKSASLALDFDGSAELQAFHDEFCKNKSPSLIAARQWFKNWVNGVVAQLQHNSSKLSMFRVVFNLNRLSNSEGDIDRWLEFAISKRVESLDLHLDFVLTDDSDRYVFSDDCYNHIKTRAGLLQIRQLRSLRLSYVDVTGEILEHFIANCPVLEELSVRSSASRSSTRLRVVGSPSSPLKLKYLEVRNLRFLKSLEIDHASRLVHFIYEGCNGVEDLRVDNCPALVGMTLGLISRSSFTLRSLSGCVSQLDSLYLKPDYSNIPVSGMAELTRLKRLMVQVDVVNSSSILGLVPFLNACPVLHTLQMFLHSNNSKRVCPLLRRVVKIPRESIKVVEIIGFTGYDADCEFVEYVMEYFVGLERIVIDRALTTLIPLEAAGIGRTNGWCSRGQQARKAEKIAIGYKSKAPATVEFVLV